MRRAAVAALVVLGACATMPVSGPSAPQGGAAIPSTPLALGDYRTLNEAETLAAFQQSLSSRYGAGVAVEAAQGDLEQNEFRCSASPGTDAGRGDPPAEVCRRTITANNCTHTWQVHLFDQHGDGHVARTRGLYDRRCGGDGLLGGPS